MKYYFPLRRRGKAALARSSTALSETRLHDPDFVNRKVRRRSSLFSPTLAIFLLGSPPPNVSHPRSAQGRARQQGEKEGCPRILGHNKQRVCTRFTQTGKGLNQPSNIYLHIYTCIYTTSQIFPVDFNIIHHSYIY